VSSAQGDPPLTRLRVSNLDANNLGKTIPFVHTPSCRTGGFEPSNPHNHHLRPGETSVKRRDFVKTSLLAGASASSGLLNACAGMDRAGTLTGDQTLFDRIWDSHVVTNLGGETDLLHVDRHFVHDLHAGAFRSVVRDGYSIRAPELTYAVADHSVSTLPNRTIESAPNGERAAILVDSARELGILAAGIDDPGQGIVHMIAPESGMAQPGMLIVCGDSHTCTQGAVGAMAWGIGSTEVTHVLVSQTIIQKRPKRMRINVEGRLAPWVTAKDIILYTIGRLGADAGNGYAVEYAGPAVRAMTMEERLTICNLSIEMGCRVGMVGPDDTTYEYLAGGEFSPKEEYWDQALAHWRSLPTDAAAVFDLEETIDASEIAPQITWGTSPEHVLSVVDRIPDPEANPRERLAYRAALDYTGLTPGSPIAGTPIQRVFIGSCANSRLSDLRIAARVAEGRSVAANVEAWVVPGSKKVKREAEAEGLDRIFTAAGFQWREPGCSLCLAANGEAVAPGDHCVSTSNRNFIGRQGRDSITHLASPPMAAAAAIAGEIVDVRRLMEGALA
jgi:3-isopropylmalate/(R)-2-methylmalate dehydratase large subunit